LPCIHPQLAARAELAAAEQVLRFADVLQDLLAARVVGLAVQRRADVPRRAVQQAHAQARLQLLQRQADRRARQLQRIGGLGEAAQFDDAHKELHGVQPIHGSPPLFRWDGL
jgi:hypothetical protein